MPYINPVNVNVTLQTSASVRQGFGTQLFVDAHAFFPERVRSYSSATAALEDFPSDSAAYKAINSAFTQSPQSPAVKVGRRTSTVTLTPTNVAENTSYTVKVVVNEGDLITVTYVAGALDDAEDIATALKAGIDAAVPVAAHVTATVVGVTTAGTLTIEATTAVDEYGISNLDNLDYAFATTEAAADTMAAIDLVDTDYALVTSSDHTEAFILALALYMETTQKQYFVSLQDELVLATLAFPATDTAGKLFDLGYKNTNWMYCQTADTTYPECAWVGRWSPTDPGTEAWFHKDLGGVPLASALNGGTTAVKLSQTQKDNIEARNGNFMEIFKGLKGVAGGKSVQGEWIHVMRFSFFIKARSEEVAYTYMFNQSKVSHGMTGYVGLRSVLMTEWNRYVDSEGNSQGLDGITPYVFDGAPGAGVTLADKVAGTYTENTTLYLSGAIRNFTVNVDLTYNV